MQQPGGVVRLHLAWFHRLWVCRSAFDIRQETRDYPQQGQQGADPEDEFDAGLVGQPAEKGRAEAAEAEHQPEKDPGDHSDLAGHQVGGVDQDGGECRGDDESDDDGERDRAGQVRIGQQQGEGEIIIKKDAWAAYMLKSSPVIFNINFMIFENMSFIVFIKLSPISYYIIIYHILNF